MNIKNRITLFSTVWLLIILLITNSGIYLLFQKNLHDNALEGTETRMESLTEAVKTSSETKMNMTQLLRAYLPADSMVRIITESNSVAATSSRITDDDKLDDIKPTYRPNQFSEVKNIDGMIYTVAQHPVIWADGEVVSLQLIEKESSIPNSLQILRIVLIIATLLILIPSYLGGRFLSKLILVPISHLTRTMEENQRLGTYKRITINKKSNDELNNMARTFNRMMDLLENNYKKQEQFVSDASHELRTPLTVIESYAKMLKRWGGSRPEILEEAVEAIHSESIRMKELTQQMLILARDESQVNLQLEQSNLVVMAKNAAKNMNKAYDRNIQVHSNLEDIHVECDSLKIKQVLIILLDNAIKYSSEAIKVELTKQGNSVRLSVSDNGIGISKENLDKVYDRFFRVDQARSRDKGGAGLGLSIAKQIVSAHQGKIDLVSEEEKGTTVTMEIPVKQS
ncbi:HAMP domain-containing sensor histidine kinase [Bacillus sp. E(2018)]|uniref:sensor histidine kinase n=1 Tax=Bacillus sp. E(2018) TaxID=2502239 RepID=UPI0010FA295A|nr:HAMP domain-containing sensor histidine kinase [Bacillus sp. E(2018)]